MTLTWQQTDYAPTKADCDREAFEAGDWPGAHVCRRCTGVVYETEDGWATTDFELDCIDGDPHDPYEEAA